jgi:hypothetical protein
LRARRCAAICASIRATTSIRARIEADGHDSDAQVYDISESGAKIEQLSWLAVGTRIRRTFRGLHPVAGKVVRADDNSFGVCFEPQKFKTAEVRRLIVAPAA